ncbi:MAG: hypothetical protein ABI716_03660 [Candidatus Saccharibacteria bacterium]
MQLSHLHVKINHSEAGWHVIVALFIAIGLELTLSNALTFGSKYMVAGLELILILLLGVFPFRAALKRGLAILLLGLISAANLVSLGMVIAALFGSVNVNGHELLISSMAIYLTNIIVFGLWYWELDNTRQAIPDFLFPQQANPKGERGWKPTFFEYLYLSLTNATAFSPTDAMPLTHRAKLLMSAQAVTSLVTVALVVARAVNILS